jgi:integrase
MRNTEGEFERAIASRLRSIDSQRYRENTATVLRELRTWLREERGVERLADVDELDCRRWVQGYLRGRVQGNQTPRSYEPSGNARLSAASAHTYFNIARAFFSWCVDDQRIDANPMRPASVREALPEDTSEPDRQFWSPEARDALLAHVDRTAHDALEAEGVDPRGAFRDRVVAYLLADTGARGAELFAVSGDDARDGITWGDVDLSAGTIRVLGKSREPETVALPATTAAKVDRYRRVVEPAGADWPVVPTGDAATKGRVLRSELAARGWDEADVEAAVASADGIDDALREHDVAPPALTTEGARRVMKRLCDAADVAVDGEYLKPHGGRRGLGHRLYTEVSAEKAQELLRHRSIETTNESYREAQTSELSRDVDDLLYGDE